MDARNPRTWGILSQDSPYFYDLWPSIIDVSDDASLMVLKEVCRWFHQLAEATELRRKSDEVKHIYIRRQARPNFNPHPIPLRLDPRTSKTLWYAWGADKCSFTSIEKFNEFCRIAGVADPKDGVQWKPGRDVDEGVYSQKVSFLSTKGDVSFDCLMDPCDPGQPGMGYVHFIGCTGEYEKVKELEGWFKENGTWTAVVSWRRPFI